MYRKPNWNHWLDFSWLHVLVLIIQPDTNLTRNTLSYMMNTLNNSFVWKKGCHIRNKCDTLLRCLHIGLVKHMSSFKNSGISDTCIGNIKRDYKDYLCMYIHITMSAIIRINTESKSLNMYLRPGNVLLYECFCFF